MNVTEYATLVRADNPGVMTLDGTNTWILRAPDAKRSVVVDPGPMLEDHLRAVLDAAGKVAVVLLTHKHPDHSEGAAWFANQAALRRPRGRSRVPDPHRPRPRFVGR